MSSQSLTKVDAGSINRIALTTSAKVRLPREVDRNINFRKGREDFEKNFEHIVEEISLGKHKLPSISKTINNKIPPYIIL